MKKFLEGLIAVIILVGICSGVLLLNPQWSLTQKIFPMYDLNPNTFVQINPMPPLAIHPQSTGLDLTNCISYFDGCNNCSVKDGKAEACTMMYCEKPSEPKCLEYASGSEVKITQQAESNVDKFFKNYHEPIDIMFKNALIKNKLDFIIIPNHDKSVINATGVAAMAAIDIDGGYRFTLEDKESVCEILKALGRPDLSCYDAENGANIYIDFKIIDSNYVRLRVQHFVGMKETDLINKTYKRTELM